MTDDVAWYGVDENDDDGDSAVWPGDWRDIEWDGSQSGDWSWDQGPNSDAMKAYDDCF